MSPTARETSPIVASALALIAPHATADELAARFADRGAVLRPGLTQRLLAELAALGLVRVASRDGRGRSYVLTTLGQQALDAGLTGDTRQAMADLERLRTDLLSTIAHELRTPLTSLRTSVGLLLDDTSEPTEEQRRALLLAIERSGDRMQRLVSDVLDLARFRTGTVSLQLRPFDGVELARTCIAVIEPAAAARGQEVVLGLPRGHGLLVYGDHRRLEQALVNLLSNAQRFSPDRAAIEVMVDTIGTMARWSVTDHGPGIPEADRSHLFERFFVGRSDRGRVGDGVGLGLPTALAIAQAHGGTIEVDSEVGVGSTFRLVVPVAGPEGEG